MADVSKQIILVETIISTVKGRRFPLNDEKQLQLEISSCLYSAGLSFLREHPLDVHNRPDFFFNSEGIAVEVKIKGSARDIHNQCARYAAFEQVKAILLITNRSMGFPTELNGKPAYYFKLGRAWL